MTKRNLIDLDALIPKREEERVVTLGGREFNVSGVPVGVAAAFLRVRMDTTYTLTDAMIDGSVAMLNQNLTDAEKIDKAWLLSVLDGAAFESVCDVILLPFFEGKEEVRKNLKRAKPEPQTTQ